VKQNCKDWLLQNVVPSSTRTGALGKYLASLAKYFQQDDKRERNGRSEASKPSASRKRLHIFYLLNDLLHHAKYHCQSMSLFSTLSGSLQPFLVDLVQSTALDCKAKVRNRLLELFGIWNEEKYYPADYIIELKAAMDPTQNTRSSKTRSADTKAPEPPKEAKELPFIMPSTHGDQSVPYFDLPAGNLMPHIMPNSSAAIRPDQVRALQFVPGPADDRLVHALKNFLKEVDNMNDSAQADVSATVTDIDDLGQVSYQDENGDVVGGDTYYGWSRAFCEKMKKRREADNSRGSRARSYSPSRSPSRSRSRSPRKKRRYSDSIGSRSASRSRSSRSRGPRNSRRDVSSPRLSSRDHRKRSRSRSYSPSQSVPLPAPPLLQTDFHPHAGFTPQFPPTTITQKHPTSFQALPNQIPFQPPLGPGGLPLPPPPPNYSGPWPPNINFPTGLPIPAAPIQQGSKFPPRTGPSGPNQKWPHPNWQGKF
jgi:hypothetical protein